MSIEVVLVDKLVGPFGGEYTEVRVLDSNTGNVATGKDDGHSSASIRNATEKASSSL
jgi:hypothetical protein